MKDQYCKMQNVNVVVFRYKSSVPKVLPKWPPVCGPVPEHRGGRPQEEWEYQAAPLPELSQVAAEKDEAQVRRQLCCHTRCQDNFITQQSRQQKC